MAFRAAPHISFALCALLSTGCGQDEDDSNVPVMRDRQAVHAEVAAGLASDRSRISGDVSFRIPLDIPAGEARLPVVLYLGLSPAEPTRLSVQTVADLRLVQLQLPELLSGIVDRTCRREVVVDFLAAEAESDSLRAWGKVHAKFTMCRRRASEEGEPGAALLSQTIDAIALAEVQLQNNCIVANLIDLQLDPEGFLGSIANALGLTAYAQAMVVEKGQALLAENPLCPELPEELGSIDPSFASGSGIELGEGGLGVELSGTLDASASTLLEVLSTVDDLALLDGER